MTGVANVVQNKQLKAVRVGNSKDGSAVASRAGSVSSTGGGGGTKGKGRKK